MSRIGNIVGGTVDLLTPDNQSTERLTFRKFEGDELAKAAELGTDVPKSSITTIILKVNPDEIGYSEPKITQKVQTAKTGRFVVFDWGTDLLALTINGNTGNMLPGIVKSGFDPLTGFVRDIAQKIDPYQASQLYPGKLNPASGEMGAIAQKIMLQSMSYYELLGMSPKYKTFMKLKQLYETFDADQDVLTLETGNDIYRGYFLDFSFTQTAMNPWNWKYTIMFVSLVNLAEYIRRGDDKFPKGQEYETEIIDWNPQNEDILPDV